MVGSTLEEKKSEENDILICKFMGLSSHDGFWRVPIEINSDKQRLWTHDVKIGYMGATKDLCLVFLGIGYYLFYEDLVLLTAVMYL